CARGGYCSGSVCYGGLNSW
nr:immunoglobulin heavy chain junction region [Macaca mulatta]MOV45971.1 immunoglobulin heavy chain junction region [Macaca mulatta]